MLELKSVDNADYTKKTYTYNRTMLELKSGVGRYNYAEAVLIIVQCLN